MDIVVVTCVPVNESVLLLSVEQRHVVPENGLLGVLVGGLKPPELGGLLGVLDGGGEAEAIVNEK